ncbi:MAG: group III truncated hemoglobin [Flavobacterium sp.]|nr:MAG: group III truncated hemoglobin [Flavobacterium sp.]
MKDITSRNDLEMLMADFYSRLLQDNSINYIFTDVAKIDLPQHLPHIVDFWEQNILHQGSYRKNVLKIHLDLNDLTALLPAHFETWLSHLYQTIDTHFAGANSELMKTRAMSVATVMQIKMQNPK